MILQYICALQAPLLLAYTTYFRQKLPSFNVVAILEWLMVFFGPKLLSCYYAFNKEVPNP